jgi:prolyl 4-hydroxylase
MYTEVTDFIEIYQSVNMDCDSIINWFINNKDKQGSGIIYRDTDVLVDIDTKDTIDISLSLAQVKNDKETSKIFYNLFANVSQAFKQYIKKYNILEDINIEIDDSFNVQYYDKGQHFKKFHFESSGATHRKRILTWMVYLNDVPDGGNTVFPYYNYSIQPIKGHILIWPAEFTHTHFGDVVIDEKYIVTGWFNLVEKNQFFMQRPTVTKEKVIYFNI